MSTVLWIVYPLMILEFLSLGFAILRRGPSKRINQMFFIFLFLNGLGLIINIIYRVAEDTIPDINVMLNPFVIFVIDLALVFLLLFNLIIWKSDKIVTDKIKSILIAVWALVCAILFFIPGGVSFPAGSPVWSTGFFLHGLIITQTIFGTVLYVNVQIYKRFEHVEIKKKYQRTIISVILLDWFIVGNYLSNFLNISWFRDVFSITALVAFPAMYFLYQGVKRET